MTAPRWVRAVEALIEGLGRAVSWLALAMVLLTAAIVVLRYVMSLGSVALQEAVAYMHAALFMIGASYALLHDGHVRVDVLYRGWSAQARARVDLAGTLLLLLPFCVFTLWVSLDYVVASWSLLEGSPEAGGLPGVFVLKSLIPLMAVLLVLSGAARAARALHHPPWRPVVIPLLMFMVVCGVLLMGYPVAFSLAGTALMFAAVGLLTGGFEPALLTAFPSRIYGVMTNQTLIAVPLFVFMGVMLEKSKVAEELLETMAEAFGRFPGGLGLSVTLVGMLMAASTGIVGATVVTMGVLSLPTMLKRGYHPAFATGTICATGTLGQIIPPSIALVLLGDVLSSAYQQAQLQQGIFSPKTVSVGDLFAGAIVPGLVLVVLYALFIFTVALVRPQLAPPGREKGEGRAPGFGRRVVKAMIPPLVLIVAVLGSILGGFATPTEAAGVGATGALLLALAGGNLSRDHLNAVLRDTVKVSSMVFFILIGAAAFSLVFRGFGGDEIIRESFEESQLGPNGMLLVTMAVVFFLGFLLDFIEITFVVVPIVGPILLAQPEFDPVWLGIMLAVNLQTSFLTPPFGFALFYLRGVAPPEVRTLDIYKGVAPFVALQLTMLTILWWWPELATWLPTALYGS